MRSGSHVFGRLQIESLPQKAAINWLSALDGQASIKKENSHIIAKALKEWAQHLGAHYYTHWFHFLRSGSVEKQESLEKFCGSTLLQSEADSRGYAVWDSTSFPFIWQKTLYIPALFFSGTGHSFDYKTSLIRSEQKIGKAAHRLLKMANKETDRVFSVLEVKQEYFLIDREHYLRRSDLMLAGKAVFKMQPPFCFSSDSPRIFAFMRDVNEAAELLGIPIKTHRETFRAQYEITSIFEPIGLAADHNRLLMEIMQQKAKQHQLACLFSEKPFNDLNGSGKYCNWSMTTDRGLNLLDPHGDAMVFFVFLASVVSAVHEHVALLRASIGSVSNDKRLSSLEAPPAIVSVAFGEELEKIVHQTYVPKASDRNRTAFLAFTGNQFEFRAIGAGQNVAWPMTVFNSIVADRLTLLLDEIEDAQGDFWPVVRKHFKMAESLFSSDNDLLNIRKSVHAFSLIQNPKTERVFQKVLSPDEISGFVEMFYEQYAQQINVECNLMIEIFRTQILPSAQSQEAILAIDELEKEKNEMQGLGWEAAALGFGDLVLPKMELARKVVELL